MTGLRQKSTIAIAMLCLLAQLFAVAHLVLVRHARCAEHGEVTHAEEPPHATPTQAVAPAADAVLAATDLPGAGEDDDHCEWLSERRDFRCATAPVLTTALVAHAPPAHAVLFVPAATRPLYRLAPKLSPPRLAA